MQKKGKWDPRCHSDGFRGCRWEKDKSAIKCEKFREKVWGVNLCETATDFGLRGVK